MAGWDTEFRLVDAHSGKAYRGAIMEKENTMLIPFKVNDEMATSELYFSGNTSQTLPDPAVSEEKRVIY